MLSSFDGRRIWHPQKIPFYVCFKGVIKSQTYNLRTKGPADAFDELKSLHKKNDPDTTDPLDRRASRTSARPDIHFRKHWPNLRAPADADLPS